MLYTFKGSSDRNLISRLARLDDAIPYQTSQDTYAASISNFSSVNAAVVSSGGNINLTGTGIDALGSIPPAVNNAGFAYTATTTTLTLYWDGTNGSFVLVQRRADGNRFTIPANNLTITNLVANTWYGFLPYWSVNNLCTIGWVQGDSGLPLIAFAGGSGVSFVCAASGTTQADAAIQQVYQGREPLSSGFMTFKTPAAGTSSGTASDGGSVGRCVMNGTHIETLGGLPYSVAIHPNTEWQRLVLADGRSLNCTPNHPLYHPEIGKVRADSFKSNDWLLTDKGESKIQEVSHFLRTCTKHEVRMPEGHLFFANGLLSHNVKSDLR